MAGGCCGGCPAEAPQDDKAWRVALWIALAVNAGMFGVEVIAGVTAHSSSLKADALDFLGDSANYAISLLVTGMALRWRARAALLKGATLLAFAVWVMASTIWTAFADTVPAAPTMGAIGVAALVANVAVAALLFRYRDGDANRRSVWICSRNDAVGNIAVVLAAAGVFGTGTAWPDLIVAAILGGLGLWGGLQIVRHALGDLRVQEVVRSPEFVVSPRQAR